MRSVKSSDKLYTMSNTSSRTRSRRRSPRANFLLLLFLIVLQTFQLYSTEAFQYNNKNDVLCPKKRSFKPLYLEEEIPEYSKCLSPRQQIQNEYVALYDEGPKWRKRLFKPLRALPRILFPSRVLPPGTLILCKSGTSEYKEKGIFCGWADPKLTPKGIQECQHAARLLLEGGYEPDLIYTSVLNRAIHSVWHINKEMNSIFLPVYKSWRLNERMYGAIQGLKKKDTAVQFGANVVQAWRRSFKARPPPVEKTDPAFPGNDRRYAEIDQELLPVAESLDDCMQRQIPLWEYKISRELRKGNNVLVVGHSNSLRGLAKIIDNIADDDIEQVAFPPGIPIVYKFNKEMKPISPEEGILVQEHTSGVFLEKPGMLKEALKRQEQWQKTIPGTGNIDLKQAVKRMNTMEESLMLLKTEKQMEKWAAEQPRHAPIRKSLDELNFTDDVYVKLVDDASPEYRKEDDSENGVFEQALEAIEPRAMVPVIPNVDQVDVKKDLLVVFVRHGTTTHNELALFTGWEDPPLTEKGVEDAKRAGRLLKRHNFEFDVVYTSWLGRAIETAWHILDELDMQWLPLVKSWRLNERHYGRLTGKSKKMVGNIYGQDKLKMWRRGFDIAPPRASSYSFSYPGNDFRRIKYVKDLRISLTETFCRSIEAREFQVHRKFPKSESLKMCMERSIPFYTQKIVPEAIAKGKRVLVTSHENAIRGILMHLCEIPKEHMNDLHLPNGLPLIYNVRRKCISLLDDGSGRDPTEVHDFGSAAQYLFRPCELTDEDFELMEQEANEMEALEDRTREVAAL